MPSTFVLEYLDKYTHESFILTEPTHHGYLMKKSRFIKDWRNRFCILKYSKLFIAKENNKKCHHMIDLKDATIEMIESKNKIEITTINKRKYQVYAHADVETREWLRILERARDDATIYRPSR